MVHTKECLTSSKECRCSEPKETSSTPDIRILTATEIPRLEEEMQAYRDQGWRLDGNLIVYFDHKLQRTKYFHVMVRTPGNHTYWRD